METYEGLDRTEYKMRYKVRYKMSNASLGRLAIQKGKSEIRPCGRWNTKTLARCSPFLCCTHPM